MRANLWLRTASRVLVRLATFRATEFYELEKRAKKLPWDQFVGRGRTAEFRVTARKSKLYHSDAIAERLEKASRAGPGAPGAAAAKARPTPPVSPQLFVPVVWRSQPLAFVAGFELVQKSRRAFF